MRAALLIAVLLLAGPVLGAQSAAPKKKKKLLKVVPVPQRTQPGPREPKSEQGSAEGGQGGELIPKGPIPPELEQPKAPAPYLRWMLHPLKRGMWVRLPIIDTDPNRGVTVGVMPIWVLKRSGGDEIRQIHAPSLTYNKNFLLTPTYRYYYYPQDDASLVARGSVAKYEREAMAQYEDGSVLGTRYDVGGRVWYNVDAGNHFFGLGPRSSKNAETNYKADYILARGSWGLPLFNDSGWRAHIGDRYLTQKVNNGPLPGLAGFQATFPEFATAGHHQSNEVRAIVDFDDRDHPVTTTDGSFQQAYYEHAFRGFMSEYEYSRVGADSRYFRRWQTARKTVTALNAKFEQLSGNAPFWLQPSLGGKYSLRAYGDGRFVDRAMLALNAEQRFTFYETHMGGVTTEFELAPFIGCGTVADSVAKFTAPLVRPVYGAAVRAVARPQVVGSIDFGAGQEGLSVFMDINYSF